eukprot:m.748737 g.748737  ORF g.748737 m.748737 type:complete len:225 (+) comp23148_c0_seq81:19-693(+)
MLVSSDIVATWCGCAEQPSNTNSDLQWDNESHTSLKWTMDAIHKLRDFQYERQCENERVLGIENADVDDAANSDMETRQTHLDHEFLSRGSVGVHTTDADTTAATTATMQHIDNELDDAVSEDLRPEQSGIAGDDSIANTTHKRSRGSLVPDIRGQLMQEIRTKGSETALAREQVELPSWRQRIPNEIISRFQEMMGGNTTTTQPTRPKAQPRSKEQRIVLNTA